MKPQNEHWQSTSKQMDTQLLKRRMDNFLLHQKAGNCWVPLWQSETRAFAQAFFSSSLRSARGLRVKHGYQTVQNHSVKQNRAKAWLRSGNGTPVGFPVFLACVHNAGRLEFYQQLESRKGTFVVFRLDRFSSVSVRVPFTPWNVRRRTQSLKINTLGTPTPLKR